MRKIGLTLLLLFLIAPTILLAENDSCSHPNEYTIDKRCYVTDKQKFQNPYNAVVGLVWGSSVYCTGAIIKDDDGVLSIYTAKHCVDDKIGNAENRIFVKPQGNAASFIVDVNSVGDYNPVDQKMWRTGDWAVYEIPQNYQSRLESTFISDKFGFGVGPIALSYNARVVGYGALKIMSDAEIEEFKQRYIKYLKSVHGIDTNGREVSYDWRSGGVITSNAYGYGKNFLKYLQDIEPSYYRNLFNDTGNLKESKCKYTSAGDLRNCQGWGGNSGGSIFDNDGNLMGIVTRGSYVVGGKDHAEISVGRKLIGKGL